MKKRYLFCLLSLPLFAQSQSIHHTWQVQFADELHAIAAAPNGHWFVGGAVGDPTLSFSEGYFAELDASGNMVRQVTFNLLERTAVTAVLPLPDGRLVVGGYAEGCDFGYSGFVALYKATGMREWLAFKDWNTLNGEIVYVTDLISTPDGILAIGSEKAQLFDLESGLELAQVDLPGYYQGAATGPDSLSVWLSGSHGISILHLQDLSLENIVPWVNTQDAFWQIASDKSDRFYTARQKNNLLLTGNTGGLTDSLNLDYKVYDIFAVGADVLLCGRKGGIGRVERRDSMLHLISGFDLPAPDLIPRRIRPEGANILLAGMELHGPPPRDYPGSVDSRNFWMQSFAPDGSTAVAGTDVALTEIIVNSTPKATLYTNGPFGNYWSVLAPDVRVRVVNTGAKPIDKVHILASDYGQDLFFICFLYSSLFQSFDNLNLQPGESVVLPLGAISTLYVTSVKPWKLCIWAAVPDGLTDTNHENDYTCASFNLTTVTAEPSVNALILYPNPVRDVLFIENGPEPPGFCRIFNSVGQQAAELTPVFEQGRIRMELSDLPAGLYFLDTKEGWVRFIKE